METSDAQGAETKDERKMEITDAEGEPVVARPRAHASERKRRGSVSAPPMGAICQKFVPKVFPKEPEVDAWLKDAISKIFLFSNADEASMSILVSSFFEVRKPAHEAIIRQGDDGDNFYLVYSGECDIFVDQDLVMTASRGDYFGELALMYHTQRAATVRTATETVAYGLDQETFNHVIRSAGQGRRREYEEFLQRVPLLQSLGAVERGKVADVLKQVQFEDGDYLIRQGDQEGDTFFILYDGRAVASKADPSGATQVVMEYQRGDYFGELALLQAPPRKVSVIASGPVKAVCIDRPSFMRLIGPAMPSLSELRKKYGLPEPEPERGSTSPLRRRRESESSEAGGGGAERDPAAPPPSASPPLPPPSASRPAHAAPNPAAAAFVGGGGGSGAIASPEGSVLSPGGLHQMDLEGDRPAAADADGGVEPELDPDLQAVKKQRVST